MFDDPKLRLYEMDEALKATELDDIIDDLTDEEEEPDWLQDAKNLLNESATEVLPIRNKANNYGRSPAPAAPVRQAEPTRGRKAAPAPKSRRQPESVDFSRTVYADEEMRESDALYVEKPQRKGAGSLVLLALLELLGMGLVVLWWMKWTL